MIKVEIEIEDPKNIFYSCLWKQESEWRAKYYYKKKGDKTVVEIEAKDANSCRALVNYFLKFLKAYEDIVSL